MNEKRITKCVEINPNAVDDLAGVLEKHKKWLRDENGGERANLVGADLREADLSRADLSRANLIAASFKEAILSRTSFRGADLSGANLEGVDLSGANLKGANLSWALIRGADLRGANLEGVDLSGANLKGANLSWTLIRGADLRGADLRGADLRGANLRGVDLRGVDLEGANLRGTDLEGANIIGAKNIPYIPTICPEEGSFIGYKKIKYDYIVKLLIPAEAKRSSATSRKCRCEFADVLEIVNFKTGETIDKIVNDNFKETVYETGKRVYPDGFDKNRWNERSNGIHFFINRKEAEMY